MEKNLEGFELESIRKGTMMKWKLVILAVTGLSLMLSASAFADTYNFYFDKNKKKGTKVETTENAEESQEESSEEANESTPSNSSSKTYKAGQVPIIINNTNTNTLTAPTAPVAPVVEEARSTPAESSSSVATVEPVVRQFKPSHWRLGTSVVRYTPQNVYPLDTNARYGGLVSLGYDNHRGIVVNLYSHLLMVNNGKKETGDVHLGADLEILPIRSGMYSVGREYTVFELGPVIGASTLMASGGNLVSVHVGGRMNWYFNESLGVTAVARANLGYVMLDAGILVRL